MAVTKLQMNNFTVFDEVNFEFTKGINIFIGPNGVGKTHLIKLLYAACQASSSRISFPYKIVRNFLPDDYRIARLMSRKQGSSNAFIKVWAKRDTDANAKILSAAFNSKTKKWDAEVTGEDGWEKQFEDMRSVFIPAKEILTNAYNLGAAVETGNVSFDDTYLDIINAAKVDLSVGKNPEARSTKLKRIEAIIEGKVTYDNAKDEFYLKKGNSKLEFNLNAEGVRKIALLWQLIKNGVLEKGAVLFWDEPEANINPKYIPDIVDILLELQQAGVQIFISTHDYFLAKYFDIRRSKNDNLMFYSLYRDENAVKYEKSKSFSELDHNDIMDTFMKLYHEEVKRALE